MKLHTLADLKTVKASLVAAEKARAAQAVADAQAAQAARAERDLFARAVGKVSPMAPGSAAAPIRSRPAPLPVQQRLDDQAVLKASLSDSFDVESLLDTDEALSYCSPGIGPDVVRKLRRGSWSVQAQLDLHGLRQDEAREALAGFVRESLKQGLRCVRVVHGKGLGSPGKAPVLKGKVHSWLIQKESVLAFVQARGSEGGAGALIVLLRPA